jgi:soluble lytic murein transglycosylase-like protein
MQVMYPVAVERGMPVELYPESLFVPELGLEYGCRQLRYLLDWANEGWPDLPEPVRLAAALAAYNGGKGGNRPTDQPNRNASYAKGVLANYAVLVKERAGS